MRADPNGQTRLMPWEENPYGLVSLWDIMRRADVNHLIGIYSVLQYIQQTFGHRDADMSAPQDMRDSLKGVETLMDTVAEGYRFPCTIAAMRALSALAENPLSTRKEVVRQAEDAAKRLRDEVDGTTFMHLSEQFSELFKNADPFGEAVSARFEEARDDIEEAAKCLALDRGTACVMHLMRAIEVALKRFASASNVKLSFSRSTQTWNTFLHPLKQMLENMEPKQASKTPRARGKGSLTVKRNYATLQEAYTLLNGVRVAWRNPSMHVERSYKPDEAEDIYYQARSLMRFLAAHIDERGKLLTGAAKAST